MECSESSSGPANGVATLHTALHCDASAPFSSLNVRGSCSGSWVFSKDNRCFSDIRDEKFLCMVVKRVGKGMEDDVHDAFVLYQRLAIPCILI